MIKTGLKNFVNNLKYVLMILGAMFIGFLFGVYGFVTTLSKSVNTITADIKSIASEIEASSEDVRNAFVNAYSKLDYSNPEEAINNIVTKEFWQENVLNNLSRNIDNIEPYISQIANDVGQAIENLMNKIILTGVYILIGMLVGYIISHFLIHKDNTQNKLFKSVLFTIIDAVTSIGLFVLAEYLISLWSKGFFLIAILFIIIYNMIALCEAYLTQGRNKIKFKEVFNFKNILMLFLTNLIVFIISFAIAVALFFVTNILVALFITLPLILVVIITNTVTAESYVSNLVNGKIKRKDKGSKKTKNGKTKSNQKETPNDNNGKEVSKEIANA